MKHDSSAWADEVLRRVRASADPQPLDQARVFSAVERRLDMAGVLPEPPAHPVPPGTSTGGAPELPRGIGGSGAVLSSTFARWGRGVTFGLATGALGYWWGSSTRDSGADAHAVVVSASSSVTARPLAPAPALEPMLKTPQPSPPPVTAEPTAVLAAETPPPRARPTRPARAKPASLRAQAAAADTEALTLREALELLQRARMALDNGAARDALASLSELERRGAGPLLTEERLVTRTLALCELGEVALAREARQELERQEPQSIYRRRLEASCASSDKR